MIEFGFAPGDVARVRFAFSPLWEAVRSLRVLADPSGHALHLPWVRTVAPKLRGLDLAPLRALIPPAGYIPDFLTPPPGSPLPDFAAELARVAATPPATVAEEIGELEPVRAARAARAALAADPAATLDRVTGLLERYWEIALAPSWERVRDLLEGDVLRRTQALGVRGAEGVFADLHPGVAWRDGVLTVDREWDYRVPLLGRGLLLVPSAFVWPQVSVMIPPYQPMLSYPPVGVGTLWETAPAAPPDALAALIGRGRAAVLAAIATPAATTDIARRLGVTPGAVSQHLGVLRACGLVTGHRLGRRVLYARTAAGDALAAAGD
ncbi:Helix-turn-helix domain protein [Actinomadura rubteroloni]|uniref:Helix-turn-helix domain protein n=1 Tax=Actinomadura rubteroloni TaxID=1926885 RepID=A0A2P4UGK2_9ACTN|nr:DUF5937 family protein [Actinomadura rubteroloni]POM24193.1 Helix-turn-helix domain protein [Actinomadura rubteroloni]